MSIEHTGMFTHEKYDCSAKHRKNGSVRVTSPLVVGSSPTGGANTIIYANLRMHALHLNTSMN